MPRFPASSPDEHFWAKACRAGECWLWTGYCNKWGHGQYHPPGASMPVHAHRYAYELTCGPIPLGLCVLHRCGNKRCVRPDHLRVGKRPRGRHQGVVVPVADRFWSKVRRRGEDECWPWMSHADRDGYGCFKLPGSARRDGKPANVRATWMALKLSTGVEPPSDAFICHHCDNPTCVNPRHLFIGDCKANGADMARKLRGVRGVRHHKSKLSEEAVREIRRRYSAGGASQQSLADEYGVAQTVVSCIVRGLIWRHVA